MGDVNLCYRIFTILTRRKIISQGTIEQSDLSRCLSLIDLTFLGVGSTLGAGIYVLAGQVARDVAGPAVIVSFFIAALASILSGLCYAEFGARVPKAGSAYVYSYVTVGETLAFIIGWNLILEYIIGVSSVARSWSAYMDSFFNGVIAKHFQEAMPMHVKMFSDYPDFLAFALCIVLAIILAVGVQEASKFNLIFTGLNLLVVIYAVTVGAFKADIKNWEINTTSLHNNTRYGTGGFAPFGFRGILTGAATCFYAFVGFDAIATTGEEAINPRKNIPLSIIASLLACCLAYLATSTIITLLVPYYNLDENAALPLAFRQVGYPIAQYVIGVGAMCGLTTSLLGSMFPVPRVIYAMASDGLLFHFLSVVNDKFKTPVRATMVAGLIAGIFALLFDLKSLVDMMSIGTLLAYTLVGISVLVLRYRIEEESNHKVTLSILSIVMASASISMYVTFLGNEIAEGKWWALLLISISGLIVLCCTILVAVQQQNNDDIYFKVPLVPVIPILSIFVNVFLMFKLRGPTWVRFGIWMGLGFLIYFIYGIRNSSAKENIRKETDDIDYPETLHNDNEKLIN
ncbi:DgyrCDS1517 [Dimorphilus gyrociliatus]|uniref:DgyrCDS1517 n=1 Tax=Dimorphilus gyrociliatus TaxID=2664684 RepID=A0A7I8V7M3_9ANNE|nr:DgyrCDS1517 [Dimorphilus gyrociliatus]